MFDSVLIANRGEISLRVQRTLSRLHIRSIAVYSDADEDAPHVRAADAAVRIGPAPASDSYLSIQRVIEAAIASKAQAIHPGYGFLSERADFASAAQQAGIAFIGPSAEAISLLGDKAAAKHAAEAAGVPVVPGLSPQESAAALAPQGRGAHRGGAGDSGELTDEQIIAWAQDQELPLLLKAAGGGGGRGMRVVHSLHALPEAILAARREAAAAFGDQRLIVERCIERARHIEVQVIADHHRNVIHLGERECSLQRRHQKVIEEAPSPVVSEQLRQRLGAAAVALARSCHYTNAGTVELIADRDDPSSFYFLEMNARLQVEHPVTEQVTGLDLVELQLRVAAGQPLPLVQEDVRMQGHAIEARIYAEDPSSGFLPSTGRVTLYREPDETLHGGQGDAARSQGGNLRPASALRIDSGVETGSQVCTHYDPMLAKVIACAPDRGSALARLDRGLSQLRLLGPSTNASWLRALLNRPEVQEGLLDTTLIERLGAEIDVAGAPMLGVPDAPSPAGAPSLAPGLALVALIGLPPSHDPWDALDGWRLHGRGTATMRLQGPGGGEQGVLAEATPKGDGSWEVDGASVRLQERASGQELLRVEWPHAGGEADVPHRRSQTRFLEVHRDRNAVWLVDEGAPSRWAPLVELSTRHSGSDSLQAPMPGVVLDVRTSVGENVTEGEVLIVLESMKMELGVACPEDGVVGTIHVVAGDRVAQGAVLLELEA